MDIIDEIKKVADEAYYRGINDVHHRTPFSPFGNRDLETILALKIRNLIAKYEHEKFEQAHNQLIKEIK